MDFKEIINEGELVKEWNSTYTINNTVFTYMHKQYKLEVNGTSVTVEKIFVYSSDGTLITDPSCFFTSAPLAYLYGFWIWWYWIVYGADYYWYTHFDPPELEPLFRWAGDEQIAREFAFYAIEIFIVLVGLVPILNMASVPLGIALGAAHLISYQEYQTRLGNWQNAADSDFGLRIVDKTHYLYDIRRPWWDQVSYIEEGVVYKNGVTNMYWKWPCTDDVAYAVAQRMIYWAGITGCNNQWVWYALPTPLPLPP